MTQTHQRYQSLRNAADLLSQETDNWETLVDSILTQVVISTIKKYQQKLNVGVQDSVSDLLDTFKHKITQAIFETSDIWRSTVQSDIALFPKDCRFCYNRGNSTIIVIEQDPQVRSLKFASGMLGENHGSRARGGERVALALPYSVFFFHFQNGNFRQLYLAWKTRPLESLQDAIQRPVLPNIHDNLNVCLGVDPSVVRGSISQQTNIILSDFWNSEFNEDLSQHWWQKGSIDNRIRNGDMWSELTLENPMFILDVNFRQTRTVQEMVELVSCVDEPVDESYFRHRLADEIDKHVEILFSKVMKYFKRTKFDKHFPKDIENELSKTISVSTKDLVDVVYSLNVEIDRLSDDLKKDKSQVEPKSVLWEEYST